MTLQTLSNYLPTKLDEARGDIELKSTVRIMKELKTEERGTVKKALKSAGFWQVTQMLDGTPTLLWVIKKQTI